MLISYEKVIEKGISSCFTPLNLVDSDTFHMKILQTRAYTEFIKHGVTFLLVTTIKKRVLSLGLIVA